ncbi:MAG: ribonuclease HII [Peptococcaceae bacterium]|nr:ribonuclease HII [Peptococcaceae bacterium]
MENNQKRAEKGGNDLKGKMESPRTRESSGIFAEEKLLGLECALWERGYARIAGIDEVGRGPWAGPVVAAACILPCDFDLPGLKDSKKLTPRRREKLAVGIKDQAIAWSVASVDERDIEVLNILQATLKAMCQAVCALVPRPEALLIDGRDTLDRARFAKELMISGETWETPYQQAVIGGDARSASIAAASILAKVARDRIMTEYSVIYPGYGFDKHKGYGTQEHREALRRLGPCPLHRMSFAPVKGLMGVDGKDGVIDVKGTARVRAHGGEYGG